MTDGDDESLRLAKSNIRANLHAARRQGTCACCARSVEVENICGSERDICSCIPSSRRSNSSNNCTASNIHEKSHWGCDTGGVDGNCTSAGDCSSSSENKDYFPEETPTPGKEQRRKDVTVVGGTQDGRPARGGTVDPSVEVAGTSSTGLPHGDDGGSRNGLFDAGDRKSATPILFVSARKLRWGCPSDMAKSLRGETGPWDVVLGSDIAALPYASDHDGLIRTIESLVFHDHDGASAPCLPEKGERGIGDPIGSGASDVGVDGVSMASAPPVVSGQGRSWAGGKKVVVLLAHKRRHISEESFFVKLKGVLGEKSCREMGEGDVHADFRGMGISLHMFEVDVR